MKIADSVLLNLFMIDNERGNISLTPYTCLSGIQFSISKGIGVTDPEGPEKYKNTEQGHVYVNYYGTAIVSL